MAIAFMPSDEDTDARYERLNGLLLELYDVLCHIMDGRGAPPPGPELPAPRVRPASDSSAPRLLPDLLASAARRRNSSLRTPPPSPSCSSQAAAPWSGPAPWASPAPWCAPTSLATPVTLGAPAPLAPAPPDDEVFLPARPPRPRRRRRCDSLKSRKDDWRDKGQALLDNLRRESKTDTTDSVLSPPKVPESENTLLSTLLSGGSLWTAVVIMLGWKLLAAKR